MEPVNSINIVWPIIGAIASIIAVICFIMAIIKREYDNKIPIIPTIPLIEILDGPNGEKYRDIIKRIYNWQSEHKGQFFLFTDLEYDNDRRAAIELCNAGLLMGIVENGEPCVDVAPQWLALPKKYVGLYHRLIKVWGGKTTIRYIA